MRKLLIVIISLYRYTVSPFLGDNCRFYPSCSHYAQDAIALHGIFRGSYLTLRRIGKCHPWHEGGADPVPPCNHTH
ncbi:membrane protein insertion efficiency factor YidD [Haliea sp. E1-2-M8]|uniref:membrane protein insertion efficiency factor YidD n=1 Tax=Haliea sp. E1-2-M8 TaxID=3064706 RepID=UPI0027171C4F|nr:membrane protein insertion efficiency factor YidD [Haliea sp. E1-2-M8]MDO8860106.1 membrane protein insertion efficiency factor YidD [Haliea sp. E1-2-M8]